jgi:hypothetical protein
MQALHYISYRIQTRQEGPCAGGKARHIEGEGRIVYEAKKIAKVCVNDSQNFSMYQVWLNTR